MAKGVFDPAKHYRLCLVGHCFDRNQSPPTLPGHFLPDTVEHFDKLTREREFAVFIVDEPQNGEYPFHWAGTYKIQMGMIRQAPPQEI